jgi:hypothetical protein
MAWTDEGSCDDSTPTSVQAYELNARYEYGDVVTNQGKQWRCKAAWPETFRCGQAGYTPGEDYNGVPLYEDVWEETIVPIPTAPTPTSVQPYELNAHYEYGDVVTNQGKQWRCKAAWPETLRCGQACYTPGEDYNGVPFYEDVWEEAFVPTVSPSYKHSHMPSLTPSTFPSTAPSNVPSTSHKPSLSLSESPSNVPSSSPSEPPSNVPSAAPSDEPSLSPSESPSTSPSEPPSSTPSASPSTLGISPSNVPSAFPSETSTPTETCGASTSTWAQLGQDIDGEAAVDYSGWSASSSSDGNIVAIGAISNDGANGVDSGHVRVYKYDTSSSSWTQLGQDIDGEAAGDQSGIAVSLSADGKRLAIVANKNDGANGENSGHVRVYEYTTSSSSWVQLGEDIDGEAAGDWTGGVSLSPDGTRVAIGTTNPADLTNGFVRVYQYDGTSWTRLGQTIDGEDGIMMDGFGRSVSFSYDGARLAIGAPFKHCQWVGRVSVYQYDGDTSTWVQLGEDIMGERADDESGFSVSLSSDGNIVAIGAKTNNNANGGNSGHVRIYEYSSSSWTQLGQDIDGEARCDQSGARVSLSADGRRVAIGAAGNDGNGDNSGYVRVFEYCASPSPSTWVQLGQDIDGEAAGDMSGGYGLSLSADGQRVVVGSGWNDGNGNNSGHVRVYELN